MIRPKKTKFKKFRKGSLRHSEKILFLLNRLQEGTARLEALEFERVTAKQLESCRLAINKRIKKRAKLQINIFPDWPVTKKPTEVRMGKGKGSVYEWTCKLVPGTIIFEISGADIELATLALIEGARRLPVKVKVTTAVLTKENTHF